MKKQKIMIGTVIALLLTACGTAGAQNPTETKAVAEQVQSQAEMKETEEEAQSSAETKAASEEVERPAETKETEDETQSPDETTAAAAEMKADEEAKKEAPAVPKENLTLEGLEEASLKEAEDAAALLGSEFEALEAEIASYQKYVENPDTVREFYGKIEEETKALSIRLCEYSIEYAELILASGKSDEEKYDDLDYIYDCIYDDAAEVIYDEIYDGVLDDMFDAFYGGVLEDGYEEAPYKEWSDVLSGEYDQWSDTKSEVYDLWSDAKSEIYDFWSDVKGEVFSGDEKRAEKEIERFREDIEEMKAS